MKNEEQGLFFFGLMDHFVSKFIQKNPYNKTKFKNRCIALKSTKYGWV
ncbi:MAG: hypothetical protein K9W44_00985 [Candidatus Lokiarchaeota archaeon]|nr:hypothetical protein [Candidatus Harpocratesius repetitus]